VFRAGLGIEEVIQNKLVAPRIVATSLGSLQNRSAPFFGAVLEPTLKLIGDAGQVGSGDSETLPVGVEEPKNPFGLLEWLDQPVQQ